MQQIPRQQAANDTNYFPPRHRTLPILASITPIANYPSKLRIFKTNASRYWQVRCYLKGKTYTQSLKTTNKLAAISQAKQFFHIKTAELYGTQVQQREEKICKFVDVVPAMLAFQMARVKRGELSAASIPHSSKPVTQQHRAVFWAHAHRPCRLSAVVGLCGADEPTGVHQHHHSAAYGRSS